MAGALTGADVQHVPDYERVNAVREMADGTAQPAASDRHPDPTAEAMRGQIENGELVQIAGRGRGVNRGPGDPLEVLLMTDVVVSLPINATVRQRGIDPTPDELMLAAGVAFENAAHAAKAYPDMLASHDAARSGRHRARSVSKPNRIISNTVLTHSSDFPPRCGRVDYKLRGAGQKSAVAWFDLALTPDPVPFITERLGELAFCTVIMPSAPAAAPEGGPSAAVVAARGGEPPDGDPPCAGREQAGIDPAMMFPAAPEGAERPITGLWTVQKPGRAARTIWRQT